MTLEKGTKVQINDDYLSHVRRPDETVTEVRGKAGIVTGHLSNFVQVTPVEPDEKYWNIPYLFLERELTVLEEAHPLQKEFAKS